MANQWIRVNPNDNDFTRRMKYLSSTGQASTGQSSSGDESSFTPNREQQAFQDYRTVKTNEINTGLDLSTASGMEAYIWNNYSGKERDDAYATLDAAYSTKGSKFYDPYRNQATNQSYLDDLKNLGVQVPETVTSDWLGQMAQQYSPYYKLSQDSGNPNSPGKKATTEQKIAYDVFKLWGDEDTTEKAENEWADMKAKVTYWAQKGLSDKEIKDKIDMKKYPTLSKMDESRKIGNIVTMNRAIGYSGDALDGVIWKARNGYGDDMDDFQAAVRSKLGQGRGDRSTAKQIAQRTVGTSEYNPYVDGSNDDDARMAMGIKSWDNEWLKAHQQDMFAAGQEDLWRQMDKELGNYESAKKQYDILDKWVSGYNYDFDAENIRAVVDKLSADLDDRLNNTSGLYMDEIDGAGKLKSLTDMDEGRRTGKPVGLSDELNYRKEDVLAEMVQRYFLQNGQKITGEQAAYAVSHADEMDKEAEKNRTEISEEGLQDNVEPLAPAAPGDIKDSISALPETDPLSKVERTPEAKTTSPDWKTQYETRTKDYQSSHPTNGSFDNRFMIPIMDMDGTSGSLRDKPRLADGAVSDAGRKAPEQKYLNTLNGKVYTRSQIEQTLTNAFMGLEPDADETDALRMLSHSIPWAFQSKRVIYSTNMNWSAFGNNGEKVFDAVDASESGYATASDQAQLVLAFYDDAAAAAAEGMNIGEYYKKNPDAYTDVQGIIDTINGRRDKQLAEDAQREEDAKTQRLAEAKTIVGKLASRQEMDETDQAFIAGITPNGSYSEREAYMGNRSANSEFFRSIDYDTQLFDVQNEWFDQQREIVGSSFDPFEQATKRQGITELMERGIVFDAKLAESAGMTLEEYYKATGTTLNLQERFREAQRAWEARESPENRTEEQNTGIGLLGVVWSGAKMGTVDTAAGFVGFAADMRSLSGADTHRSVKDGWMNYMSGGGVQGMVESRSAYRTAVLAYANSLNESDPQRAEAIRGAVYEAAANGEDIFNVAFDITLDKLERTYESLQKVNAVEQEYIDTHATEFEKNTVRQWRSAVSSLEKMAISAGLTAVGAPGAVAGAVAFFPGTYDSTYRAEVASNGGDKTSAAVYAGISALIDTITEQSFMSKWYNFGGEAAQSWLLNIQKSQLAKIGPAGQAGNLAHRAAAYFLGWAATASAETMQELGQDGVSAIWDFVYHGRDVNWLKDQFDFINNPEARENLADTVASTLMSVTLSFNGQQIFGRGNITREGDGATAFSSYSVLQRNRLVGEQMRKLDAQRKVDEQTLAEDTSGLTADIEEEAPSAEVPAAVAPEPETPAEVPAPVTPEAETPAATAPVEAEAPVSDTPEAEAPAAPAESAPVASASPDTEPPATPEQNTPAAEKPISPIKKRDPERTRLENGQEPRFVTQANLKLSGMKFDVQRINKCLDQLTDMQADLQNLSAEEFFDKYAGNFRSMIEAVNYARDEGFNQGLEISSDISSGFDAAVGNFSTEAFQVIMNSLVTEFNGELGQRATQISETIRDVDLKFALYTAYTTPGFREEIIGQLTERYTADAIMAGRLTEDADAKAAVKATETAKNELDAATEEQNQAEAALQTAQQNLDNVTANRGQEGWSPKQEISAAKGVDTAKKNAETSRKKAKNSKEKYDRAKENSDAVLDAKRESLEAEAKDVATVKFDQEAAEFTTNVNHIDEPIVPDTPAPNAEPTTTIRTNEENAALAQDANAEANRLDSLTPEQEAAETQQNAEGLAKAEEEEENLPMQGPKLPITTTFGNRLRSEAVNEKGKQILTKAQTDSIEKAIIADNDMADFYNDLSAEDLIRFVNDFKGKTRSRTASFMRNWMAAETQNRQAAESGIDKAAVIKNLKSEVRKAIKAKDYSIVEKAMEKYIEGHEDLFDIALDADGIYIDGENISFNGAFSEDMSDGVGDAPADTDTPDINDQMESLLPEQEEPEGEPMELPEEEEAPAAEQPAAEQPAEAPAAEAPAAEAPVEEQPAAEAPVEEKPKRKRAPKKPKPVIAEEVSMESTSDSLTQSLSDDLKAAISGDKLAQAIIKQVNDAQNAYNKAQADIMDDTKKIDITAMTQAMDETKEKIQQMTESFNRRVGMLQRKVQADQRAEARKSVDRSEARQAEVSTLLEGVAKRVEKILDKAKNSKAKNPKPLNYKDARDLVADLRSILDVGLATMENDIGANEIGKLAETVKAFTPAFDAVNELSELTGEEAAPGSIKSLNAAFIRAGKALVASQANRNASDEGKQTFLDARTALTAARNKLMAYAHDMDARLEQMTPVESRAYADLSRPGRRTDITAGPETQAKQSPIKTFQRLANDLRIGHYDVDRKTIPRRALGVYHPFSDAIGISRNHANDAYVTMHEIGHAIEERTNFHGDMAMISAADPALMSQYSAADQPHEAVAEFVRTYMMDRQSAISVYGQATVDRFETECKSNNIWKEVSRAALDIHDYTMANTGSQVRSRISNFQHRKQSMGLRRTIHEGLRAAIVNTTDDTIAAKDFDDIAAKDRSDNAMSVRQRLRFGKFASRQGRGLITEQYSTPDNQITGVSFAQAISEDAATGKTLLKTQEDYDILSRYMLLLQARTRYANAATEAVNNLPATATAAEIDAAIKEATAKTTVFGDSITINEIGAEIKNIEDNYGNVVTAQRQLAAWWQTFMRDWMPVAGISAQTVEDLIEKYPNYCPTQRDMPDGRNGRNTKNSQNSNWAYGFQRIKGSDLDVINPLITMQSTIVKTVEAARRNEAVGAIVQALNTSQDLGEYAHIVQGDFDITTIRADMIKNAVADAFGKAVRSGLNPQMSTIDSIGMFIDDVTEFRRIQYTSEPNTVAFQQDGKVTLVKFDDPVLYDAVMAGNPQAGPIASVLGKLTRNMSLLTTGMNVLFTAKNLVRDYQQGTVWGSWNSSIVSPLGLAKWIAAASEVIRGEVGKNSQHLAEYKAMGGEGYGSINMPSSERQANDLMRNLYEMYGMNAAQKGGLFARKALIDWIDTVNGVIEQTTRYVEYRYGKHDLSTPEGRAKAFLAAQDATVDFARKGNGKVAASLRAMIPFYNAALQGTWQVFDAAVDNDQKGRRAVRAAKLAVNNMILGAMSYMALQMIGSDEDKEWYEKLPLAIRLDNIVIPFKDSETHARQFIRLPVAQNWASRAFYATGLALARGNNGDEDGMNILAVAGNILNNWLQTDFIFAPELAIMKNQSWTGSTLVPSRMEGWKASEQFNQTTPEIFKFLSRGLSQAGVEISPIHLQYLAQQHSGVLGQVFIPMMSPDSLDNYQLNPVGQVLRTLRNSWTIDPAYTNDINDAYYEGKSFIENIPAVIKEHGYSDRLSTNLSDEEAQDAVDTAAQMVGTYGALTAIDKQIGEIRAQQNTIIENTELSPNEKEVQRRNLQREIVKLEEQAVGIINEYKMKYCTGTDPLLHTVFGGAHAGKASVLAGKPTQFLDDYRAGEEYIKTAVDVYAATGESVIPNPATSITSNKEQFKIKAFAEDDGTPIWDSYVNAYQTQYKKAYATYDWKNLSDEQKVVALKACGKSANAAAKAYFLEWYRGKQR